MLAGIAAALLSLGSPEARAVEADAARAEASAASPDTRSPTTPEEWWDEALEELFADVELTEAQQQQIDAIVAAAARDRARYSKAEAALDRARRDGDAERADALAQQVAGIQEGFKPNARIDTMRALLTPEQQETFDVNRRLREDRLLARRWSRREADAGR